MGYPDLRSLTCLPAARAGSPRHRSAQIIGRRTKKLGTFFSASVAPRQGMPSVVPACPVAMARK